MIIRSFDFFVSILLIIIFTPFFLFIFLSILFFDGLPVFFKQERIGLLGKKFFILKFRTMSNNINISENLRITRFGKILRKTSLDELPQLFNVLKMEMSIVGPRPLPANIEQKIKIDLRAKRRMVLPGLTGLSQINYNGKYRKLSDKVELDLMFIENYSFYLYLKIILITPLILLTRFLKNKSSIIK